MKVYWIPAFAGTTRSAGTTRFAGMTGSARRMSLGSDESGQAVKTERKMSSALSAKRPRGALRQNACLKF